MVRDKIIFIDSDGTVIDSMNFKHFNCFGPAMIDIFKLNQYADDLQKEWNRINLFSITRGINRFDGLYQMLAYVNDKYQHIDILADYKAWLDQTEKKSNQYLADYIVKSGKIGLQKVIDWSNETNARINKFKEEVKPFDAVKTSLAVLAKEFILVVISSANFDAINHEWTKYGLKDYVDEICTQEMGTKSACISKILDKIKPSDALMIGDALSDLEAAIDNEILFYPIIPKHENESWKDFVAKYKDSFNKGNYRVLQGVIIDEFKTALEKG